MANRASRQDGKKQALELNDRIDNPETIKSLDEDPYQHIADLGDGAYGIVDKVQRDGKFFARKRIRFSTGRDRVKTLRATQKEFAILKRLRHRHIIEVVEIFQCKNRLRIIMAQVAETDMKEFMERVDSLDNGEERDAIRKKMQIWPGCLLQALDYLHEMRVKHRDLKPANILVKGDKVLITDFWGVERSDRRRDDGILDRRGTGGNTNVLGT